MIIIVTGAAGLIGSHIIQALNQRGISDIVAVDHLADSSKIRNLARCRIMHYLDKAEFIRQIRGHSFPFADIQAVFHAGGYSDFAHADGLAVMDNNYQYSIDLLDWCQDQRISLLYASSAAVYGNSGQCREELKAESPPNVYAYSKFLFDQAVRMRMQQGLTAQIAGFRYFHVYGPDEAHKGRAASAVFRCLRQYQAQGFIELPVDADRPQFDLVCVEDVAAVNLHFFDSPVQSGIFNVATGSVYTYNQIAAAVINACRHAQGLDTAELAVWQSQGLIRYLPSGNQNVEEYAVCGAVDTEKLRAVGYAAPFYSLEEGLARYAGRFSAGS